MKSKGQKRGFTIIELLTVMSIIVVLMGILMPSFAAIRRYAKAVKQKGQFHDISTGLEMFSIDFDGYPDSSENFSKLPADPVLTAPYCGAMKLCEAMLGKDGLGFHPSSRFVANGTDETATLLYPAPPAIPNPLSDAAYATNIRERKHPYIDPDKNKITSLKDLIRDTAPYTAVDSNAVICDVYQRVTGEVSKKKVGLPVLYYKADTSKLMHDSNTPVLDTGDVCNNIYDYRDNYLLLSLHEPGMAITDHPMYTNLNLFYKNTWNKKSVVPKPYNESTYILMSAGWDGLYGTKDDVYNFGE